MYCRQGHIEQRQHSITFHAVVGRLYGIITNRCVVQCPAAVDIRRCCIDIVRQRYNAVLGISRGEKPRSQNQDREDFFHKKSFVKIHYTLYVTICLVFLHGYLFFQTIIEIGITFVFHKDMFQTKKQDCYFPVFMNSRARSNWLS